MCCVCSGCSAGAVPHPGHPASRHSSHQTAGAAATEQLCQHRVVHVRHQHSHHISTLRCHGERTSLQASFCRQLQGLFCCKSTWNVLFSARHLWKECLCKWGVYVQQWIPSNFCTKNIGLWHHPGVCAGGSYKRTIRGNRSWSKQSLWSYAGGWLGVWGAMNKNRSWFERRFWSLCLSRSSSGS